MFLSGDEWRGDFRIGGEGGIWGRIWEFGWEFGDRHIIDLSEFVRDIKVNFALFYNRRYNRRGCFWGDRFKSVFMDRGETLINCLAYIDPNPLRAGMVDKPEKYCAKWHSVELGPKETEFQC